MAGDRTFVVELERFVREHELYLRAMACKLAPNPSDAEDLVQDTFLIAVKKAGDFDPRREIRPWLAGILRNLCRRAWEDKVRKDGLRRDSLAEYVESMAEEDAAVCDEEMMQALRSCLDAMPEQGRTLVNLHYEMGRRAKQIAEEIGTTPENVRVALSRMRTELKRCVERRMAACGSVS